MLVGSIPFTTHTNESGIALYSEGQHFEARTFFSDCTLILRDRYVLRYPINYRLQYVSSIVQWFFTTSTERNWRSRMFASLPPQRTAEMRRISANFLAFWQARV